MLRPLKEMIVTSAYGPRIHPVTGLDSFHKGTDYFADIGTPLYAIMNATVVASKVNIGGVENGYGYFTILDNGNMQTLYAHMQGLLLNVGDVVKAGDIIGYSGDTGRVTGPHLHLEIRLGEYVDINNYLEKDAIDPEVFFKEMAEMEKVSFNDIINKCSTTPETWKNHVKMIEMLSQYYDDLIVKSYQQGYMDALSISNNC